MKYEFRGIIAYGLLHICWIFPIKKGKILFSSFDGKYFNDSPAAIFTELQKRKYKGQLVWILDKRDTNTVGGLNVKVVPPKSIRAIYELATSNCWIDNKRKQYWVRKRRGQFYIQLWHGDIALKKVEKDAEEDLEELYILAAKNDSSMADLFVSGSRWRTKNYKQAFWYDGKVLEVGMPKSDIFFMSNKNEIYYKVINFYGLCKNINIILYAPTFRKNKDVDVYDLDLYKVLEWCEKQIGGKWIAIKRLHPNVISKVTSKEYGEKIINGSTYQEINELIIASRIVITDYSSVMFDAMATNKKVLLYVKDAEAYQRERNLYWSINELPFPKLYSNREIDSTMPKLFSEEYEININEFSETLGIVKVNDSAKKVTNEIINYMNCV